MQEIQADIWSCKGVKVIPTNLQGIMGKGLALQAKKRYLGLEDLYRSWTVQMPGRWNYIFFYQDLLLFHTKYLWSKDSDLALIRQVLIEVQEAMDVVPALHDPGCYVYLPRIGCGLGNLDWGTQVLPLVEKHLGEFENVVLVKP